MNGFITIVDRLRSYEPSMFTAHIWNGALDDEIAQLTFRDVIDSGGEPDLSYALAVKAGLHLWNESLELSHKLALQVNNETGSYWHAIMHRMEGDYQNAKYWFDQVGDHPVFHQLQRTKQEILTAKELDFIDHKEMRLGFYQFSVQKAWDPLLFIDLVQAVITFGREPRAEKLLAALQLTEIIHLLEHSYRHACGCGGHFVEPSK